MLSRKCGGFDDILALPAGKQFTNRNAAPRVQSSAVKQLSNWSTPS
jgi:hypothetical protein